MENVAQKGSIGLNIVENKSVLRTNIFVRKDDIMFSITDQVYQKVAGRLMDEIGSLDYFNGTVECQTDEYHSTLVATLIVYRNNSLIDDIIPVWWEFHTAGEECEKPNDFSFSTLKEFVLSNSLR